MKKMLKTPSKFLATIQIGITLAGFLSSAFASDTFAEKLAPTLFEVMPFISLGVWKSISIVIITVILSFFTLVLGELVPKRLAMKNYEKISFAAVGVIKTIAVLTAPFVRFLTFSILCMFLRSMKVMKGMSGSLLIMHQLSKNWIYLSSVSLILNPIS